MFLAGCEVPSTEALLPDTEAGVAVYAAWAGAGGHRVRDVCFPRDGRQLPVYALGVARGDGTVDCVPPATA